MEKATLAREREGMMENLEEDSDAKNNVRRNMGRSSE